VIVLEVAVFLLVAAGGTVGAVALPLMIVLALAKVRALAGGRKDDAE
jgi:hypothetical protein